MSLPVIMRRQARREFDDAADWYEERRQGLGAAFTVAVQRVIDRACASPRFYAAVHNDVREGLVRGFPYCVYYREETDHILVLAVFHSSRDPAIWKART